MQNTTRPSPTEVVDAIADFISTYGEQAIGSFKYGLSSKFPAAEIWLRGTELPPELRAFLLEGTCKYGGLAFVSTHYVDIRNSFKAANGVTIVLTMSATVSEEVAELTPGYPKQSPEPTKLPEELKAVLA